MSSSRISSDDIDRWSASVRPFPLPDFLTPIGGCPLATVDDETLLIAPPQLIVHVQRTAAQGGLQVISPRQTPFSTLMTRVHGDRRELGDHVVGVSCDPAAEWPTIDGATFDHLLPDEPLPTMLGDFATRSKTKTESITQAGRFLSDPILGCLVKGRAVIDILRRDDVAGDADAMTELLADAWGIETQELDDLDAFTLGIQGPLLRHALKADEVYSVVHLPNQVRRVITVGAAEVTRELLPLDTAMDWRRMRVFCEAVYAMSCSVEGIPLREMRSAAPPGNPEALGSRPGVMTFLPAPATAWTFEASTFSIYPANKHARRRSSQIPREVMTALARYTEVVRPVSYAQAMGHRAVAKRTTVNKASAPLGETIGEGYRLLARSMQVGSARGKTAAATVRNLIYDAIESAPFACRLRLAKYLMVAKEEAYIHLGLTEVPDMVIDKVAIKFVVIGDLIRLKVVAEAARRGSTAEEWWSDIVSQAPGKYRALVEGTQGWARVGMWLVFKSPTERWSRLVKAVHYQALREAQRGMVGSMPLPPQKGSKDRLVEACRLTVKAVSKAYAGYYVGMADVGMALSDAAYEMGRPRTSDYLREAAILWHLRSRCLRGTNIHPIAREEETPSVNHLRVFTEPVDILLKPTPYRAFEAYRAHAASSPMVSASAKKSLADFSGTKVSECFENMVVPICVAKESALTRFMVHPQKLSDAMEKAWGELTMDLREVAERYGATEVEGRRVAAAEDSMPIPAVEINLGPSLLCGGRKGYFDMLGRLDGDTVEWLEDVLDRLDPGMADQVTDGEYEDPDSLVRLMLAHDTELAAKEKEKPLAELVK